MSEPSCRAAVVSPAAFGEAPAMLRLALYQPDIPQNTAAVLRTAACLGIGVDIIEPCGFVWGSERMRRAGMDYMDAVEVARHTGWPAFLDATGGRRLVLLTTRAETAYTAFEFAPDDTLLFGRESAGVPDDVHARADARLVIPMAPTARSLNLAAAAAMVLGEAARQLGVFEIPAGAAGAL